jgi:nucleoid-associated protein YgaU
MRAATRSGALKVAETKRSVIVMTSDKLPPRRPAAAVVFVLVGVALVGGAAWLGLRTPPQPTAATQKVAGTTESQPAPAQEAPAAEAQPAQGGGAEKDAAKAETTGEVRPSFDIVRVSPGGSTVVAGRAAPGAEVALLSNGQEVARTTANSAGQFVMLPEKQLPIGGQELSLRSNVGNEKPVASDATALVVVPPLPRPGAQTTASVSSGRAAQAGTSAATSAGAPASVPTQQATATPLPQAQSAIPAAAAPPPAEAPVAVLMAPNAVPRVLQGPDGPTASPNGQVALTVVDYDDTGSIRFAGTARPGTTVRAYVDDQAAGDAPVDARGHWGLIPKIPVSPGNHRLRADNLGPLGAVLSRMEVPFERVAFAAPDMKEGRVVVQPKQTLWRIARIAYGQGVRYTVIYKANQDQIRNPDLIYPGQVFSVPTLAPGAAASGTAPAKAN